MKKGRLFVLSILTLCGCAPSFNLREPIYIVPKPDFRWKCESHGFYSLCRKSIIDGTGMWFEHLPPQKRPAIIIADEPPQKTKNKVIYIDIDPRIKTYAYFRIWPRPLAIILKELTFGPILDYYFAHEFGHALGFGHVIRSSIMRKDAATLKPTPSDIKMLCKKYPELDCK